MPYPNLALEKKICSTGVKAWAAVDEAGRGALAGPLVAAAVILDWPTVKLLRQNRKLKIKDSKLVDPQSRQYIFQETQNLFAWALGAVEHWEIDSYGLTRANLLACTRAIGNLPKGFDYILLDYVHGFGHAKPFKTIVDGDYKIYSVALASIFAKVCRDNLMAEYHRQFPQYHFDRHKGYGTKLHQQGLKIHGPCPIHRRSFNLEFDYSPN